MIETPALPDPEVELTITQALDSGRRAEAEAPRGRASCLPSKLAALSSALCSYMVIYRSPESQRPKRVSFGMLGPESQKRCPPNCSG